MADEDAGAHAWQDDVRASYDRVAAEYAERIAGELDGKPFDRALLDRFAALVRPLGPACDLGCGPGHVAAYLHDRGLDVFGIDLSPAMVDEARRLNPGLRFEAGTMPYELLAGLNAMVFETSQGTRVLTMGVGEDTPRMFKIVGVVSLFSWFAVLYFGRMLPYIGTGN